jgi:hypothetical protein
VSHSACVWNYCVKGLSAAVFPLAAAARVSKFANRKSLSPVLIFREVTACSHCERAKVDLRLILCPMTNSVHCGEFLFTAIMQIVEQRDVFHFMEWPCRWKLHL